MHRTSTIAARVAPLIVLVLALVMSACGAAGMFENVGTNLDGGGAAAGDGDRGGGQPAEEPDAGGPGGEDSPPLAAPIEQWIVKTGEVTLEVGNVGESLSLVRAMTTELGGYVGGSQAGTLDDRATITLRIPATAFEEALARLHEMEGKVLGESTREQDVTAQVVDLEARIENLEASEASYRELVARAERVEDILAVQSRLDEVRGEIEQLTAQLEALEGQAALSTLTVTLIPASTPVETTAAAWDPAEQLDQALAALVGIGQGLLEALIWFGVVWVPILLVLTALVLVAIRAVVEVRRRMPSAPSPPTAAGDGETA